MALVVGQNSWATVLEADEYLSNRVKTGDWFSLPDAPTNPGDESKETYLITSFYTLIGWDTLNLTPDLTDENVKNAQIEFAFFLLNYYEDYDKRMAIQAQGVTRFEFSKREEEYKAGGVTLPPVVEGLLSEYSTGNTFFVLKGQYDSE